MFAFFFKSWTCVGPCLDLVDICVGFSNLLLAAVLMIELICTCLDKDSGGYSWNSLTEAGWTSDTTTDHRQAISNSCAALPRSTSDAWGAEWRALYHSTPQTSNPVHWSSREVWGAKGKKANEAKGSDEMSVRFIRHHNGIVEQCSGARLKYNICAKHHTPRRSSFQHERHKPQD